MYDICCVGHITSDKIITDKNTFNMPGGTAWYFSHAMCNLDINYLLLTSLAQSEMHYIDELIDERIPVQAFTSTYTVFFENIYADNQDHRVQNVLAKADPFTFEQLQNTEAKVFHLGPLLTDDITSGLIKYLASKSVVSLDVQGFLREVVNEKVIATAWEAKNEVVQYVSILKADETELQVLTGSDNVHHGIEMLMNWGLKEVVITNGSFGSIIYGDGLFYEIPAYPPKQLIDATGCGDTYMAGYLYSRAKGFDYHDAGHFAAAMASLKMESPGPFTGTAEEVYERIRA